MKTACFDIETVPNDRAENWVNSQMPKAPANYKDPLKIAAKELEAKEKLREKLGLHWWTGRVVLIVAQTESLAAFIHTNEKVILNEFATWLQENKVTTLVGKSSDDFDIPFLIGRYIANDLGIPYALLSVKTQRELTDIDNIFGYRSAQQSTLENYAFGMGIDGKNGHWSDVQKHWNDYELGNAEGLDKLIRYCQQDVAIVKEFLRRTRIWNSTTTQVKEELNVPF